MPPPPQVWPAGQEPQSSKPPQPSGTGPQSKPGLAQLPGTHASVPPSGVPPPVDGVPPAPATLVPPLEPPEPGAPALPGSRVTLEPQPVIAAISSTIV